MATDPWMMEFRALHDKAKKNNLSLADRRLYMDARETLAKMLAKIQGLAVQPNQTARQAFRVAVAMQVTLTIAAEPIRAVTLDLGTGGFSTVLQKVPMGSEAISFELKLPGGVAPLVGRAKMVDSRKQVGNFRAAFAFQDLGPADLEALEWVLFDNVLSRLGI